MPADPFVSYAQNGEDVLLWRALGHVPNGSYVDVGAWHATVDSVTKAFYDRGWRGVSVEPVPEMAAELREMRPGDEVVEAAVSTTSESELTLHRVRDSGDGAPIAGLSTLEAGVADAHVRGGWDVEPITVPTRTLTSVCGSTVLGPDIHFLKVDVEGAEADVLHSLDLAVVRPWVLVVEATRPNSTEPSHEEWEPYLLDHGYEFCLFDGLSRYYTAAERPELRPALSYPVCVFDDYVILREHELRQQAVDLAAERTRLRGEVVRLRAQVQERSSRLTEREAQVRRLRRRLGRRNRLIKELRVQLAGVTGSASWRVTRPLRAVRSRVRRPGPAAGSAPLDQDHPAR